MKQLTFINFKEIAKNFDANLKLWIVFKDGNEITIKNISFQATVSQMYFKKAPVTASLKAVWDRYNEILEKVYKDKWTIARIYHRNARTANDYLVQYLETGVIRYNNQDGDEIPALRFQWDSEYIREVEKGIENNMNVFLIKIKDDHTPETVSR